ncbi:MAG: aldo/keto reductase [Acidobacteriota bacterium]
MTSVEGAELRPGYSVSRWIHGGWQLSAGHRPDPVERGGAVDGLVRLAEAGLTTFDCADIYTGVEELYGEVLRRFGPRRRDQIQIHTKFVPDLGALGSLDRGYVTSVIDRSLRRLGTDRLDLVQFHWWDFEIPGWADAAGWLDDLRTAGKIRHLAVTNFDVPRLRALLDGGLDIVAHQLQYSLLDRRPEHGMAELCAARNVHLLCYGSLAGGFLTDRWVGRDAPEEPLGNRSLVKYRLIIDEAGGWVHHRHLLEVLSEIARRHGATVAQVAARWVLDRPGVAAVVVGTRGARDPADALRTFELRLNGEDLAALAAAVGASPRGDIYHLERIPGGRHAVIMKTGLNRPAGTAAERSK